MAAYKLNQRCATAVGKDRVANTLLALRGRGVRDAGERVARDLARQAASEQLQPLLEAACGRLASVLHRAFDIAMEVQQRGTPPSFSLSTRQQMNVKSHWVELPKFCLPDQIAKCAPAHPDLLPPACRIGAGASQAICRLQCRTAVCLSCFCAAARGEVPHAADPPTAGMHMPLLSHADNMTQDCSCKQPMRICIGRTHISTSAWRGRYLHLRFVHENVFMPFILSSITRHVFAGWDERLQRTVSVRQRS